MKKLLIFGLICLVLLCLRGSAVADPYLGEEFPSDKHFSMLEFSSEGIFLKSLGKYKNQDGSYTVYFLSIKDNKTKTSDMRVFQLDTNYWIAISDELKRTPSIVQNIR
jgi:hypothetical protein